MTTLAAGVRSVSKTFGATRALSGVDFDAVPGEIHALIGENGAGKTTLVKLLARLYDPTGGAILLDGVDLPLQCDAEGHDGLLIHNGWLQRRPGTYHMVVLLDGVERADCTFSVAP